jgi:putative hydrolase of HD superfamily
MLNLRKLFDFVEMTNSFKKIERDIPLFGSTKLENDVEHSYQLAMVCWYIASVENIDLHIGKILKYALIHDLPEVYAGDTPLYTSNDKHLHNKADREKEAMSRLQKEFVNFPELHTWIQRYEEKVDEESNFVYAVDKLLPIISIYLDKGHAWRTHNIDLSLIIEKNKDRISASPIAEKYFNLIVEMIQEKFDRWNRNVTVFKEAISYDGKRCDVHHVNADHFDDVPDDKKTKAHAVCLHDGKMLLVNHPEWDIWSIPGGTREQGETAEEALEREVLEETNCKVIDSRPIAYQKVVSPRGDTLHYRLLYLCTVVPQGEFKEDPAGSINKIDWINPRDFESYIENKEFKKAVIRRALPLLKHGI